MTFVWSRNIVRESSHISFFCGGDFFCEVVRQPENTHGGANRFAWVTCGPPASIKWSAGLCLPSIITDLILSFQVPCGNMIIFFASRIFCLWLVIGTYLLPFFPGNLLILSANGNICHSIHRQIIIFFAIIFYYYLSCETTLLMLSCDRIESAKFIHVAS